MRLVQETIHDLQMPPRPEENGQEDMWAGGFENAADSDSEWITVAMGDAGVQDKAMEAGSGTDIGGVDGAETGKPESYWVKR